METIRIYRNVYKTDIPNANGHIYPKETVKKALDEYFEKNTCLYGQIGQDYNPDIGFDVDLSSIAISIKKEDVREIDGGLSIRANILDTPNGKILSKMLEDKCPPLHFGFRSCGQFSEDNKTIKEMKIMSCDILLKD